MAELLDRARQLVTAGPYSPRAAELAAVHAAIYPSRDAVCETCPGELGKAYYAIKRWVHQQDNSPSTSTTSTVKKSEARFHNDTLTYTPHGLGIAYTNDNLTDSAARYILKNDPDAAQFFKVLPPDAEEGEDDVQPVPEQATATESTPAPAPAQDVPVGFDYDKLASAMLNELERREAARNTQSAAPAAAEQPALTASAGGAADAGKPATDSTDNSGADSGNGSDGEQDDESPVRLSRMNKAQLVAAYTTEVGSVPADTLTNDDLREAIAAKRTATPQA